MPTLKTVSTPSHQAGFPISLVSTVDIAVLTPCCNDARAIGAVVSGFGAALPQARIYIYDNNNPHALAADDRYLFALRRHLDRCSGRWFDNNLLAVARCDG
jgi:hypothetical protein